MSIPITLICGYLGAGKTTYINHLLRTSTNLHGVAVIVNDFGSVNIDQALIEAVSADGKVIGLANGCVCCTVGDDLASSLDAMATLGVAQILFEASGVAAPAKLKQQCNYPGFHCRGAVVLAAMDQYEQLSADKYVGALFKQQLAEADVLALTKAGSNAIDPDVADVREYSINDPQLDMLVLGEESLERNDPRAIDAHTHFATTTLVQQQPTTTKVLRQALSALPPWVSRVKGFAQTDEGLIKIQRVGTNLDIEAIDYASEGVLVLIYPENFSLDRYVASWPPTWHLESDTSD